MINLGARISNLLSDIVLTPVVVVEAETFATRFIRVRLESQAFKTMRWVPGDKLQFRVRPGTVDLRTYTPINRSTDKGTIDLIAFDHGSGPGACWFTSATIGARCEIFGPSRSINLPEAASDAVFIGDETSIALAAAMYDLNPAARFLIEASDTDEVEKALSAVGVSGDIRVFSKSKDRTALLRGAREAAEQNGRGCNLVMSGDATTVSAARRAVRQWANLAVRVRARAYWSPGRTGLS